MPQTPVPLGEVVASVAEDAEFEAQERHCHVHTVIPEGDWGVRGNDSLLHSAVENVVRNAIRYTTEGSSVEIALTSEERGGGAEAVLRVSDSGPGVPEDALGKLFEPFYRLDDARGRLTGGVGLGLAITERAVRFHGGKVSAFNRPEGGLMVEIRLPLISRAAAKGTGCGGAGWTGSVAESFGTGYLARSRGRYFLMLLGLSRFFRSSRILRTAGEAGNSVALPGFQ